MKTESTLLDADDSTLIVIDVQDKFLQRLEGDVAARVVERIEWLVQVADWLRVPTIVTAEEIEVMGPTTEAIRRRLPDSSPDMDKMVFGLAGQADIFAQVAAAGRQTAVLVVLETDVCVAQSALGLRQAGYRVSVVEDACGSPPPNHDVGIQRMREAGVVVTSTKALYYEWVRDLENHHRVQAGLNAPLPAGMTL